MDNYQPDRISTEIVINSSDHILIVEDNRAINTMLSKLLHSELGVSALPAETMAAAAELIEIHRNRIELAIVDLNLPDAPDGEIVDLVLEQGIPTIILTGSLSEKTHRVFAQLPIVDYVVKRAISEATYVIETVRRTLANRYRNVLVIDDQESSLDFVEALLQRHLLNVIKARSASEGLRLFAQRDDIELVITDYQMAEMNGVELTLELRKLVDRTQLAILGISASTQADVPVRFLKSGANDFLVRPFVNEEFYCRLNNCIDTVGHYRQLAEAANIDFLTGLGNRRTLFSTGEKLFRNALRGQAAFSVGMVDIDRFKKINDTYGHRAGDAVIRSVADRLQEQLRDSDLVTRVGGEEFCVICNTANEDDADGLFNRLCRSVSDQQIMVDGTALEVTVSIGYINRLGDSLEKMIQDADQALYVAKESGRNRVIQFAAQGPRPGEKSLTGETLSQAQVH